MKECFEEDPAYEGYFGTSHDVLKMIHEGRNDELKSGVVGTVCLRARDEEDLKEQSV